MTSVTGALDRAIASLEADNQMVNRLGVVAHELEDDIATLRQLRDEFARGPRELRESLAAHPAGLEDLVARWKEDQIRNAS
jgi:hypothetical protein